MQSKVFIGKIIGYDAIQSFRALVPHEHQRVDQIERGKYGFGVLKKWRELHFKWNMDTTKRNGHKSIVLLFFNRSA